MDFKVGQIIYMLEDRSDFKCRVIGRKISERLIDGKVVTYKDFLIERERLNSYHVSFDTPEKRTFESSYRYYEDEQKLVEWKPPFRSGEGRWEEYEGRICKRKPKNLRIGPSA